MRVALGPVQQQQVAKLLRRTRRFFNDLPCFARQLFEINTV